MEPENKYEREAAIRVVNWSKRFDGQQILAYISFEIAAGEVSVVPGSSGSGRTTLLRIIAGLEEPETGEI
jgi:ABC-type Fe3+/spermidine/putrescine transport system ATPase subunit